MTSRLSVFWDQDKVGTLTLTENRYFSFFYEKQWLMNKKSTPISLALPLTEKTYGDREARSFFSNLLPEADVKNNLALKFGVSQTNDFKLLEILGGDCAGALSLLPEGQYPTQEASIIPLTTDEIEHKLSSTPSAPFLYSGEGFRLSLAGAQDKLPVFIEKGLYYLPKGSVPSSHILKPPMRRFPDSVFNEYFCMKLAQKSGLSVASVEIKKLKVSILVVKRFDRIQSPHQKLIRLHQEDFCQALGLGYNQKYEAEGGPTLKNCFETIGKFSTAPILDKKRLLEWVLFNTFIGNCDAHAKNISFLFSPPHVQLSPFYDLISTMVYPALSQKLAMKIGGENRLEWIQKRHWHRLADDAIVKFDMVRDRIKDFASIVPGQSHALSKELSLSFPSPIYKKITEHIEKQANHLMSALE